MSDCGTKDCLDALLASHCDAGLYMHFDDGLNLEITEKVVRAEAERMERDMEAYPPEMRAAAEFSPCRVCPARDTAVMCHALPAIAPFLVQLNAYQSFDEMNAVYVDHCGKDESNLLYVSRTSLQRALQYVAMQSVLGYCEVGRLYFKYFSGIVPFAPAMTIAERIYANIMLEKNGDLKAVESVIEEMRSNLMVTMACQLKRVRLVSRTDVFMNAFVNLHMALEMLGPEQRRRVREQLARREAGTQDLS